MKEFIPGSLASVSGQVRVHVNKIISHGISVLCVLGTKVGMLVALIISIYCALMTILIGDSPLMVVLVHLYIVPPIPEEEIGI